MTGFTYKGVSVAVPRTADIPRPYRPDGQFASFVQMCLDNTPRWQDGDDPIETLAIKGARMNNIVVPVDQAERIWATHIGHAAKKAGVSPFVQQKSRVSTSHLTIELVGTPKRPILVRAYPGEYMPPLPWMKTAAWAQGGRSLCLDYWLVNAYVFAEQLIVQGSRSSSPAWFNTAR